MDVRALPLAALGASALTRATASGDPAALATYAHPPGDAAARAEAARRAAARAVHRDADADVLAEQNRAWGAGADALALIERLREPEAVAVVTGQQLGLFAGPLYTPYKALSAVRLAERLHAETGRPVVPVFWLADEDHDFEEVQTAVFSDGPDVRHVVYHDGHPAGAPRGPVGRIVLDEVALADTFRQLEAALPAGPYRDAALAAARDAYRPGRTMRDAFARLLVTLAPGLVLMSADDVRLKRLVLPLMDRELAEWEATHAVLTERSDALVAAGFHAQVAPTPVQLFWIDEAGARRPLDPADGGLALRGAPPEPVDVWRARAQAEPDRLSPNVVLRPLVQDTLLPTAAYVAGPGEAAYYAQLTPVYERFGVPMPVIEPRLSLTLVDPGVAKILDRYGLDVPDVRTGLDALWRRFAQEASDADLPDAFEEAHRHAEALLADLETLATDLDTSLSGAAGATRAAIDKALRRFETKTVRVQKRQHQDVRDRLDRAHAALWPDGALQERAICPLQVVARQGPGALESAIGAIPLDARVHYVVRT